MKVFFIKVHNDHNNLRDDIIEGETPSWPQFGKPFYMIGPPRDAGNLRFVNTSPVSEVMYQGDYVCSFLTQSGSHYLVIRKEGMEEYGKLGIEVARRMEADDASDRTRGMGVSA